MAYGSGKCISSSSSSSSSSRVVVVVVVVCMCACVRVHLVVTSKETDWRSTLNREYYTNGNNKVV